MKTFHIVALLAISVAFLSCSTNEPSVSLLPSPACKMAAKQGYEEIPSFIKEYDGYNDIEKLDPSCKSEERKFFYVYDTNTVNPPDLEIRLIECQKDKTTYEEIRACKDEGMIYWDEWRNEHKRRDLPIPCVVYDGGWWGALLTDEEVAELEEIYSVSINGQPEYKNDVLVGVVGGNGNTDIPPPTTVTGEKRCGE